MPTTNPLTPIQSSSPGQLQIIRNNSNSWTIRNVDREARWPIVIGPGGTEYGARPPPEAVDNVKRFHEGMRGVWGDLSVYGDNPGFNFGFRQPYVWISLTDSNTKKYIKKFDSQGFAPGAVIQDVQRMTKMMASGKGVFFALTQFALQKQNAFNETRIWNPLTIITATARKGAMGLMDYPQRHLDAPGGGLVNIVASAVKSSIGINNPSKDPVPGTATMAGEGGISNEANTGAGLANRGLPRFEASANAQTRFATKWVGSGDSDSSKSGFLAGLGKALIKGLSQYIPSTKTDPADWKLRVEYASKSNVFDAFLEDRPQLLSYTVRNTKNRKNIEVYVVKDVHVYTPDTVYSPTAGKVSSDGYDLQGMQQLLSVGRFSPNEVRGKPVINKRDNREFSTETTGGVVDLSQYNTILKATTRWNSSGFRDYKTTSKLASDAGEGSRYGPSKNTLDGKSTLNKGKKFAGAQKYDEYNALGVLDVGESKAALYDETGNGSADLIFFYFYDLVNKRYIPFRATVTGINENISAEWDDVQYMGRADKLYTYKGFTRDLNFSFTVYANSVRELVPMWKRVNYLSGLTRPSRYTDGVVSGSLTDGGFMYPPLITFRIGDMFVDQPAIIRSFGLTVPDDAPWETTRTKPDAVGESAYSYLNGTHQKISMNGQTTMQLPMKVDISISMTLMEKRLSQTADWHYFATDIVGESYS